MRTCTAHRPNPSSLEPLESRIAPATITVTTLNDVLGNDGLVSLREAVAAASTNLPYFDVPAGDPGLDHIVFDPSLSGTMASAFREYMAIGDDLTIDGSVANGQVTIEGFSTYLTFFATSSLALSHLTLGKTAAALYAELQPQKTLQIDHVDFHDNLAYSVYAKNGTTQISHSTFTHNSGPLTLENSTVTMQDCSFTGNAAPISSSHSTLTILDSSFTGNSSGNGVIYSPNSALSIQASSFTNNSGGPTIYSSGSTLTVDGTSFTGNSGAISTTSATTITKSSFTGNSSIAIFSFGAPLTVRDSSFTGNLSAITHNGAGLFELTRTNFDHQSNGAVRVDTGTAQIQDCSFIHTSGGSALFIGSGGNVQLTRVNFDQNSANTGGAINNGGTLVYSGGLVSNNEGGGVFNLGTATLTDVDFTANHSSYGGAITDTGTVEIHGGFISNNVSDAYGGAILHQGAGTLTITGTDLVNNRAAYSGGAIYNVSDAYESNLVTLTHCVVQGNMAYNEDPNFSTVGGGYYGFGNLTVIQSTFDNNSAGTGGNLWTMFGTVLIHNSTIADGHATTAAGGLYIDGSYSGNTVSLFSTIIARNDLSDISINLPVVDPNDPNPTPVDPTTLNATSSLIQTLTGTINGVDSHNLVGVDAKLGTFGDHGGLRPSINLLPGSPAIDAGANDLNLAFDQRGLPFARVLGAAADIGSFEAPLAPVVTLLAGGKKAQFHDVDGDLVTISTSKGAFTQGDITLEAAGLGARLVALDLANHSAFAGANISIKAVRSALGGDGFVNVGTLDASGEDLGSVLIDGDVTTFNAGDPDASTPGVRSLSVVSAGAFEGGGHIQITGALNVLKVRTDLTDTAVTISGGPSAGLGKTKIIGSVTNADIQIDGSVSTFTVFGNWVDTSLTAEGSLGAISATAVPGKFRYSGGVVVKGSILGGHLGTNGDLANLRVSGDLQGARVTARGDLAPADVLTAQTIGQLAVGGRVFQSDFLVGYDLNAIPVNPDVQVDKVAVTGSWVASSLAVGADRGTDHFVGTADDAPIIGGSAAIVSRIASLTIKGAAYGSPGQSDDFYGIAAEEIASVKIALTPLVLTAGASNDTAPLFFGPSFDFALHEVGVSVI